MTAPHNKGRGLGIEFLRSLISHEGDECVIWPLFRDPQNGYGRIGYLGKHYWSHRLMCEMAKGPPPSPDHEASHSCGRGHEGCVHPKHLSWKTATENQRERRIHGTHGKGQGYRFKLTPEKVAEIRAQKEDSSCCPGAPRLREGAPHRHDGDGRRQGQDEDKERHAARVPRRADRHGAHLL